METPEVTLRCMYRRRRWLGILYAIGWGLLSGQSFVLSIVVMQVGWSWLSYVHMGDNKWARMT